MTNYISKQAGFEEVVKKYINQVWKSEDGFFENILRIATYLSPFLGVGMLPLLLSSIGSAMLGYGISDFGKWLDEQMGSTSGKAPSENWEAEMQKKLMSLAGNTNAHISHRQIKNAGLMNNAKVIGYVIKGISKVVMALFGVYGISTMDDLVRQLTQQIRDVTEPSIKETFESLNESYETSDLSGDVLENNPKGIGSMIDSLEEKYGLGQRS